jgi:predicted TIM-barrel fold metal-dependent hydrolase
VVVDHQWHWVPVELLEALEHRSAPPRAERSDGGWVLELAEGFKLPLPPGLLDLDEQLQVATDHGIDVLVSSPVLLAEVLHLEGGEAAELLEQANGVTARAQREHPDRFVGIAFLPLQDTDAALSVLEKAAADGLSGVSMLASIDGKPIATDATLPVFKRIEELGLPILLHPACRSSTLSQRLGMHAEIGLGWMYHTALAAVNLIQSGTLDECPGLTILHPHLGGMLPYVLGRVDRLPGEDRSLPEYLRRHFYTDAVSATPAALQLAIDTYGLERVLFATDYPFVPIEPAFGYLEANASPEQARAIFANVLPGLELPAGGSA